MNFAQEKGWEKPFKFFSAFESKSISTFAKKKENDGKSKKKWEKC